MANLAEKINRLLRDRFPGAEAQIEPIQDSDMVSGFLVWEGFVGQDQIKRQRQVWKWIKKELPGHEWVKVGAVLTTTPAEMAVMREG